MTPLDELELTPESLQALEFGPDRILEGEGVFHLRASHLDEESGLHSRVGIWIGRSDFLFKRAIYGFESPEGLEHDRTLHFSDYGAINRNWAASDAESPGAHHRRRFAGKGDRPARHQLGERNTRQTGPCSRYRRPVRRRKLRHEHPPFGRSRRIPNVRGPMGPHHLD